MQMPLFAIGAIRIFAQFGHALAKLDPAPRRFLLKAQHSAAVKETSLVRHWNEAPVLARLDILLNVGLPAAERE